ncbi:MAG TPA: glycosyltransferase family 2 protein [Candidatus Binatia bacterium]|nr:glycosyltransferase family 2 protein [Candidatus Binatia bacterium]
MSDRDAARAEGPAFGAPLVRSGGEPPLVAAVVVNHDGLAETRTCVASLRNAMGVRVHVVVVDNASREAERRALADEYAGADDVELVLLPDNRHFAGGVNAGAERGIARGAAFLMILNNDTELEPGCLAELVATATAHHDAGIVGPALLDTRRRERALSLGERYSPWSLAVPRTLLRVRRAGDGAPYRVGGVMGSALLVTRECFLRVGPYREDLLVYYEEVDFCLRARALGYRPMIAPRAIVRHDGMRGFASGLTPYAARLKARNQLLLLRDHGAPLAWIAFLPIYAGLVATSALLYELRGRHEVVAALWSGVREGVRAVTGRRRPADSAGPA